MTEINMTDEDAALAERNRSLAMDMLRQAHLVTLDPIEQAVAMITASTVILEREVGTAGAGEALRALVDPTLTGWARQAGARA